MPLPVTFANLPTGNNPASLLDQSFLAVANMGTTYCTATGTNTILLTVAPNQPTPTGYANGQQLSFLAPATNTGPVTIQVGSLAAIPLRASGAALGAGALIAGTVCDVSISGNGTTADLVGGGGYLPLGGGTLTGNLTVASSSGNSNVVLNAAAGTNRAVLGQTTGSNRWNIILGNTTAEAPTAVGSDLTINRFDNTGTVIDTPLTITRSTGNVAFTGAGGSVQVAPPAGPATLAVLAPTGAYNANILMRKGASGQSAVITGNLGANARWAILLGDAAAESSGNVGSNFSLYRYNDAGAFLDVPISTARNTGTTTFSVAIVNGPSDRSLKENIAPLEGALDKVTALQGVSFNFIKTPDKREIGLIAQDVEPVLPEVIQPFQNGEEEGKLAIDYPRLVAVLIEAVKELTARVEALEAEIA